MKPVVISFYAGDKYYYECAEKLRSMCDAVGVDHDIEEIKVGEGFDWANICRLKVQFYKRKLTELKRPVLWMDVDSEVKYLPELLDSNVDFAAFLRGFRDLSNYDPIRFTRTWAPSFLFFNHSEGGLKFVDEMARIEKSHVGNATDDYFLEEAWRNVGSEISALPIPRKYLSLRGDNPETAAFVFGDSGNVTEFKGKVLQHENKLAGNYVAGIVCSWLAKISNKHFKQFLIASLEEYSITDLAILLKLSKTILPVDAKVALKYAVRASYLYPRKYESSLAIVDALMKMGQRSEARAVLARLAESEYPDWKNLAKSKLVDFDMETEHLALGDDVEPISMWWAKTPYPGNIGDILNPYIIKGITGTYPKFTARGKGLLAIGSIIKWAEKSAVVWGSGTSRFPEDLNPYAKYCAVRGPLTRNAVMANGGYCPEVYGDPALLLPLLYQPNVTKSRKVGYIPHYQHADTPIEGDYYFIDILGVTDDDIHRLIDEICSCEYIVSTSLHGIIIANAYGVPARWATVSGSEKQVHGDNTKFKDYFLGVGLPVQEPMDLTVAGFPSHDSLKQELPEVVKPVFDAKALLGAFPYQEQLLERFK